MTLKWFPSLAVVGIVLAYRVCVDIGFQLIWVNAQDHMVRISPTSKDTTEMSSVVTESIG